MKNIYITPDMNVLSFATEDVITTSYMEKGVQYSGEDWGTGTSWMNGTILSD